MSLIDLTLREQLKLVDEREKNLLAAEGSFRQAWLSPYLFRKKTVFVNRLNMFQDQAQITPNKISSQIPFALAESQQFRLENNEEETETEKKANESKFVLNYPLAGLLGIGIVMTGVLAFYKVIPPMLLIYVILACIAVAASPYIMAFVKSFFHKEAEKLSDAEVVQRAFEEIHVEYEKSWRIVVEQPQTREELQDNPKLGLNEVLYNREKQEYEVLSLKISKSVGKIMGVCLQQFQMRRETIYITMNAQKQASIKPS
jgi:hypothetical protein